MDERIRGAVGDEPAWVVGGALRDELLGREVVDVDVACPARSWPRALLASRGRRGVPALRAARRLARRVPPGKTVDFTPLHGETIEEDLATRDFTVNALARPLDGGALVDPFGGGPTWRPGGSERSARRSSTTTRCAPARGASRGRARLRLDEATEELVRAPPARVGEPAGERILGELERLSPDGFRRADELGLLEPLGGLGRRPRPGRSRRHARLPPGRGLRRRPPTLPDLQRPAQARRDAARGRARRRRLAAGDPPLPPPHRAVGALGAGLPRSDRPVRRGSRGPRRPTTRSRSSAGTTCSPSASSPARRSAACSSWSRRSAPSARSRRATRRSSSCARARLARCAALGASAT